MSVRGEPRRESIHRGRVEKAVTGIVGAGPDNLYWFADSLGDLYCLVDVVDEQPSTESTSDQCRMGLFPPGREFQHLHHYRLRRPRRPGGRPYLTPVPVDVRN